MVIEGREAPVYGLAFHPEKAMTNFDE